MRLTAGPETVQAYGGRLASAVLPSASHLMHEQSYCAREGMRWHGGQLVPSVGRWVEVGWALWRLGQELSRSWPERAVGHAPSGLFREPGHVYVHGHGHGHVHGHVHGHGHGHGHGHEHERGYVHVHVPVPVHVHVHVHVQVRQRERDRQNRDQRDREPEPITPLQQQAVVKAQASR